MSKKRSLFVVVGLVCVLILLAIGCAKPAPAPVPPPAPAPAPTTPKPAPTTTAPAAKITWSDAERMAPTHILAQTIVMPVIQEVLAKSNGRLEIKPYWSESLIKNDGMLDALSRGTVDVAWVTTSYFMGTIPIWSLPFVPGVFNDYQHMVRSWNAGIKGIWSDYAKQKLNAHIAGGTFNYNSYLNIYSNKSIPKRPADIKGLKIGSFNYLLDTLLIQAGAAPATVASADLYLALQRGTIDGSVQVPSSVTSWKLQEVTKYANLMPLMFAEMTLVLISEKAWANLPPDVQKIVDDAYLKYFTEWGQNEQRVRNDAAFETMKKAGMTLYTSTPDDIAAWRELAQPVWDKYVQVAGEAGKKQLDIAQKAR